MCSNEISLFSSSCYSFLFPAVKMQTESETFPALKCYLTKVKQPSMSSLRKCQLAHTSLPSLLATLPQRDGWVAYVQILRSFNQTETAGCKEAERSARCVRFPSFTSKINHLTEKIFLSFFNTVAFDGLSYGFLMYCTLPLVFSTDLKPCKNCRIEEHKGLLWSWMQKTKRRERERGEKKKREKKKKRGKCGHTASIVPAWMDRMSYGLVRLCLCFLLTQASELPNVDFRSSSESCITEIWITSSLQSTVDY